MKCPKCQAENREGVKFCEDCGEQMDLHCPSCGSIIIAGKKFCGECGTKLVETEAAENNQVIAPSRSSREFDLSIDRALTPLVGRQVELEHLVSKFNTVNEGRGQAISLMGEAGTGKSRLIYEFKKALFGQEVTIREARCSSYGRGVAYHLIIDILKANFRIREEDINIQIKEKVQIGLKALQVDETSTLPYLMEFLAPELSGIDKESMSVDAIKYQMAQSLIRVILKSSEQKPLVVIFEDLHWIDKSSEGILKTFLEHITDIRVMLIFAFRPDEYEQTWPEKSHHNHLTLSPFSREESLMMAGTLLDSTQINEDLEELILARTQGNPFYIEELVKSFKDLDIIEQTDNAFALTRDIDQGDIPSTIQDVILARVDSLPNEVKEMLLTLAVLGRVFSFNLAREVVRIDGQKLYSNLKVLRESELVFQRGKHPNSVYLFKHALTQSVIYSSILEQSRQKLHEKIGKTIETLFSDRLAEYYELLAYHFEEAGNHEKALTYLEVSGDKAVRNNSDFEAIYLFKRALAVIDHLPDSTSKYKQKRQISSKIVSPMTSTSFPDDSQTILQESEKLALEMNDESYLRDIHFGICILNIYRGNPHATIEISSPIFKKALADQNLDFMAPYGITLALAYESTSQSQKVVNTLSPIIDLIEKTKNEWRFFRERQNNSYSYFCIFCCYHLSLLGDFRKAQPFYEKALNNAIKLDDALTLASVYSLASLSFSQKGDVELTITNGKKGFEYGEKSRSLLAMSNACIGLGSGFMQMGTGLGIQPMQNLAKAQRYYEKSLKILQDNNYVYLAWICERWIAVTHIELENLETALVLIKTILPKFNTVSKFYKASCEVCLARIYDGLSQHGKAIKEIKTALDTFTDLSMKPSIAMSYYHLSKVYSSMGLQEEAIRNINKAEKMFIEMDMGYWPEKARAFSESLK